MERTIARSLLDWKDRRNRKPLLVMGARQVGKTWAMKEFGREHFKNMAYVSLDNNARMANVFGLDFDIGRILSALRIETGEAIHPQDTLLVLDEIQEVPQALSALKYFCENAPEYAVAAAGSLLGVALHEGTSFPVGKVDFLNMFPLTFSEFLTAIGEGDLAGLLEAGDYGLSNALSGKYADLLRRYYFVGGMPEAVQAYLDTDDLAQVRRVQRGLLRFYENDFSRHAPKGVVPRIRMVWDSIAMQLAKENRKFVYGAIRKGARAKDFEPAIQWLLDCGLLHRVSRVAKPGMPLVSYLDMAAFKLYLLDVGLLGARGDLDARVLLEGDRVFEEFKGSLTEQYAAQELAAREMGLYYCSTENSSGEVDLLVQRGRQIVPIEVKAQENLRAKSLSSYCAKYRPQTAVRTSLSNYREQDWMVNVPLYALAPFLESLI
jgi:predicted AAA+ superfamily ATPase